MHKQDNPEYGNLIRYDKAKYAKYKNALKYEYI